MKDHTQKMPSDPIGNAVMAGEENDIGVYKSCETISSTVYDWAADMKSALKKREDLSDEDIANWLLDKTMTNGNGGLEQVFIDTLAEVWEDED